MISLKRHTLFVAVLVYILLITITGVTSSQELQLKVTKKPIPGVPLQKGKIFPISPDKASSMKTKIEKGKTFKADSKTVPATLKSTHDKNQLKKGSIVPILPDQLSNTKIKSNVITRERAKLDKLNVQIPFQTPAKTVAPIVSEQKVMPVSKNKVVTKTPQQLEAAAKRKASRNQSKNIAYTIELNLSSDAEIELAKKAGIQNPQPGIQRVDVGKLMLQYLQNEGITFKIIGGISEVTIQNFQSPPESESQEKTLDTGDEYIYWNPDPNYFLQDRHGVWVTWNLGTAPVGSWVTMVEYRLRVMEEDAGGTDFYCSDYIISLSSEPHGQDYNYCRVWNRDGGHTDNGEDDDVEDDYDIYLAYRTTSQFNGENPNQEWYAFVGDFVTGNDGEIDYIQLWIHWETSDLPNLYNSALSFSPTDVYPGEAFNINGSVTNNGGPTGSDFWINFYLSTSNLVPDYSLYLDSYRMSALSANETKSFNLDTTIPSDVWSGYFYVWICIDTHLEVTESNEDDNENPAGSQVHVLALPNLVADYTPSGWDFPIVPSSIPGTHTVGPALRAGEITYVDIAFVNRDADIHSSTRFYVYLYSGGSYLEGWYWDGIAKDHYGVVEDYEVRFSAGNHTLKTKVDATDVVYESNEDDNEYSRTFYINPTEPNLIANYTPSGWDYPIVPSSVPGTHTVGPDLKGGETTYIDFAFINRNTDIPTSTRFYTYLYSDGTYLNGWYWDGIGKDHYGYVEDYQATFSAGNHTLKTKVDATDAVLESNENDNEYLRTFYWREVITDPNLIANYTPSGWDLPIVPSSIPGTHTVGPNLKGGEKTYVDFAFVNRDADIPSSTRFYLYLYNDGNYLIGAYWDGIQKDYYGAVIDYEYTFSAGDHTLKTVVDATNVVPESNENDNEYQHRFSWPGEPVLTVNPESYHAPSSGGSAVITVTNSGSGTFTWTALDDRDWIGVSPTSGSPNETFTITVQPNTGPARSGTVTVTAAGASGSPKYVPVTQDGAGRYFTPVWTGSPYQPMTIFCTKAVLATGQSLGTGDEIGVFDGNKCVGAIVLEKIPTQSDHAEIICSKDDGTGNGFIDGNTIIFKFWVQGTASEHVANAQFIDLQTGSHIPPVPFTSLGTAVVELTIGVTQTIDLNAGWNIFSLAVTPDGSLNMLDVLSPILEPDVIKVIDEQGHSIVKLFGNWNNSIGDWQPTEGYYIKVTGPTTLMVEGIEITTPLTIPLNAGWNIISYPCLSVSLDAISVVQSLINNGYLVKVIDEQGRSIVKIFGNWNNSIGDMQPGEGYYVNVNTNCTLVISCGAREILAKADTPGQLAHNEPQHFQLQSAKNPYKPMNIFVVQASVNGEHLNVGDELALFEGDKCIGASVLNSPLSVSNPLEIIATMDDGDRYGFTPGDPISFKTWRNNTGEELIIDGTGIEYLNPETADPVDAARFEGLGTAVLAINFISSSIEDDVVIPHNYHLYQNHPNPFNPTTMISYDLPEAANVRLEIYDLQGNVVKKLVDGHQNAGYHCLEWDGRNNQGTSVVSGIYFCKLSSNKFVATKKMILTK